MSRVFAVLLCAGQGKRFGAGFPKTFLKLEDKYIFEYSLEKILDFCDFCVITLPLERFEETKKIVFEVLDRKTEFYQNAFQKVFLVEGGKTRQESLFNAVSFIKENLEPSEDDILVEHDGARPLFSKKLLKKLLEEVKEHDAVVPYITPADTVRVVEGKFFVGFLDRDRVGLIQTPQVFRFSVFLKAIEKAKEDGFEGTDGASLVERLGVKVKAVEGERNNIKITFPHDIEMARVLLSFSKDFE